MASKCFKYVKHCIFETDHIFSLLCLCEKRPQHCGHVPRIRILEIRTWRKVGWISMDSIHVHLQRSQKFGPSRDFADSL